MGFEKIISIHGVPRSGTSWVGQIYDSSKNVRYKFQPLFSYAFKNEIGLESTQNELMKFYTRIYNYEDNFLDQKQKKEEGVYPSFNNKYKSPEFLVTKMVRYHYLIPHLLKTMDNLKVVGIIRHPCAVLNSWRKAPREFLEEWNFKEEWRFAQSMNKFKPEQYYGFNKWKEATKLFLEMKEQFKERFYLINYENLVDNPLRLSKELLNFAGIEWGEQTEEFIENSTTISQEDVYSVYKGSKDTEKWKQELDEEIQKKVLEEIDNTELKGLI